MQRKRIRKGKKVHKLRRKTEKSGLDASNNWKRDGRLANGVQFVRELHVRNGYQNRWILITELVVYARINKINGDSSDISECVRVCIKVFKRWLEI